MQLRSRNKRLDVSSLHELLEESNDVHSDAMRVGAGTVADLRDVAADRAREGVDRPDPAQVAAFEASRSALIRKLGLAAGGGAGFGAVTSLLSRPASADTALDVQMLQTAVSLELLAVATYGAALTLPFISGGNPVIVTFAKTTMSQHDEHRQAFSAQIKALGGADQTATNPKYTPIVEAAKPTLKTPADVVALAATLEQVATETYLADLNMYTDVKSRVLMASVMGVECQHLATLRAVGALLAGAPDLIKIPIGADVSKLPAAAGSVAFPDAFEGVTKASPPSEGAVK